MAFYAWYIFWPGIGSCFFFLCHTSTTTSDCKSSSSPLYLIDLSFTPIFTSNLFFKVQRCFSCFQVFLYRHGNNYSTLLLDDSLRTSHPVGPTLCGIYRVMLISVGTIISIVTPPSKILIWCCLYLFVVWKVRV